jgi:predicted component of type VI protein secretion system
MNRIHSTLLSRLRLALAALVLTVGVVGCGQTPTEKKESQEIHQHFACQEGVESNTEACEKEKDQETKGKEIEKEDEALRESKRLEEEGK